MITSPTLTQYLIKHLSEHPDQKELVMIMSDLATIAKMVSRETNRTGLVDILGSANKTNIQGEDVKKLDVLTNDLCKDYLRGTGHFATLSSEEEEGVVDMGNYGKDAKYIIAFDPLDGSSNIDVNIAVGTIFSVYRKRDNLNQKDEKQFLRPGKEQVLAGYILYSSSTVLVFSFGDGVHEFTLEQSTGEFMLSRENIKVPENSKYYSTNATYTKYLQPKDIKYIEYLRDDLGLSDRHIGSLVADFHRNLIQGGVFMYFANNKNEAKEYKPKIRLLYEINPLSFLIEQAGGAATDGKINTLDKVLAKLHERSVVVIGNKKLVDKYLEMD